jgi:hypothetical protein
MSNVTASAIASNNDAADQLALEGGPRTIVEPLPFAGFGAELIGEEEEKNVVDAIRGRKLCRITHPFADSYAHRFEEAIRQRTRAPFALVLNSGASAPGTRCWWPAPAGSRPPLR